LYNKKSTLCIPNLLSFNFKYFYKFRLRNNKRTSAGERYGGNYQAPRRAIRFRNSTTVQRKFLFSAYWHHWLHKGAVLSAKLVSFPSIFLVSSNLFSLKFQQP